MSIKNICVIGCGKMRTNGSGINYALKNVKTVIPKRIKT